MVARRAGGVPIRSVFAWLRGVSFRSLFAWLFGLVFAGLLLTALALLMQSSTSDAEHARLGWALTFFFLLLPPILLFGAIALALARPKQRWLRQLRLVVLGALGLLSFQCGATFGAIAGTIGDGIIWFLVFALPFFALSLGAFILIARDSRNSRAADA